MCTRYWRCDISGAPNGILNGKTIALKDNVAVAGIPMMNGSQLLEGYIPDVDASVVTRILDQGGRILGKAVCENLCFNGGSFTAVNGLVKNPLDPSRMSGGSSSGSAVLVSYYNICRRCRAIDESFAKRIRTYHGCGVSNII
jgi:amidase